MEIIDNEEEKFRQTIAQAVKEAFAEHDIHGKTALISRRAVAKRLGVDVSTLWRWNRDGYLRAIKIGGKVWYTEETVSRLEHGEREM